MNTLPHHAQKGNPPPYTVYALAEDVDPVTWQDVTYIGLSNNLEYRFQQHLSCSHEANPDKNRWVRERQSQGKQIKLLRLEENIATIEQGRAREQYFIRYAMEQGADLFNRAITYTDEERIQAHQRRAVKYARIAEILAEGVYVKRLTGNFYPTRLLGKYTLPPSNPCISLVNCFHIFFETHENEVRSIHGATDNEFDAFICQYIQVASDESNKWHLQERRDAIEFARYFIGGTLDLFLQGE